MLRQLILIRHTELEWINIKNPDDKSQKTRLVGHTDIPLSKKGIIHSKRLAKFIKSFKVNKLYSSPLIRALSTAQLISKQINIKITNDDSLKEINFGDCEGMFFSDLRKKYSQIYSQYLDHSMCIHFPNGESLSGFNNRVDIFFEKLIKKEEGTVVIVTHGGVIRSALCKILNLDKSFMWQIKQDYGAINILFPTGQKFLIDKLNYTITCQK